MKKNPANAKRRSRRRLTRRRGELVARGRVASSSTVVWCLAGPLVSRIPCAHKVQFGCAPNCRVAKPRPHLGRARVPHRRRRRRRRLISFLRPTVASCTVGSALAAASSIFKLDSGYYFFFCPFFLRQDVISNKDNWISTYSSIYSMSSLQLFHIIIHKVG